VGKRCCRGLIWTDAIAVAFYDKQRSGAFFDERHSRVLEGRRSCAFFWTDGTAVPMKKCA